jgi:hypothetical protein
MYALNAADQVMSKQYADSDKRVNRRRRVESEFCPHGAGNLSTVKEKESDPITEYLRFRIRAWLDAGNGDQQDFARKAGLITDDDEKTSEISQVLGRRILSVGVHKAAAMGKVFGFDYPALADVAFRWWNSDRTRDVPAIERHGGRPGTEREDAINMALRYGVTEEQIGRALARFSDARHERRDALWWMSRFEEERRLDGEPTYDMLHMLGGKAKARAAKVVSITSKKRGPKK